MTLYTTTNPRRQHETHEAAERAIEIYYLPRNPARIYEVVEIEYRRAFSVPIRFAVKSHQTDGAFEGYCYDPDEVADSGEV